MILGNKTVSENKIGTNKEKSHPEELFHDQNWEQFQPIFFSNGSFILETIKQTNKKTLISTCGYEYIIQSINT